MEVFFGLQGVQENRALRLKDIWTPDGWNGQATSATSIPTGFDGAGSVGSAGPGDYLDERSYVAVGALKPGEDPYARNRFNQRASDKLPSNRPVPDERSSQ